MLYHAVAPRTSMLNPCAREWFPAGYHANTTKPDGATAASTASQTASSADAAVFQLSELPLEILSSVIACMNTPQDMCNCLLASHQLQTAVGSARLKFELSERSRQLLSFPPHIKQLDDFIKALLKYMPAVASLNLSMLPLEHHHVRQLAMGLVNLQHLDLSGCKKLRPGMTGQLLQHLSSKHLQSVNLQRCFQLTDACLTDLLEYACAAQSSSKTLQCIALSHLNLAKWPAATAAAQRGANNSSSGAAATADTDCSTSSSSSSSNDTDHLGSSTPSTAETRGSDAADICRNNNAHTFTAVLRSSVPHLGDAAAGLLHTLPSSLGMPVLSPASTAALRVVVLNNCSALPITGLISIAVACPLLQFLFLGGSTLQTPALPSAAGAAGAALGVGPASPNVYVPPSVASAAAGGLGAAVPLPAALQQLAELLCLPETVPWETLSRCCGVEDCSAAGSGHQHCSCSCSCCSSLRARLHCSSSKDDAAELEGRALKRLHRNEPSAAAVASARAHALSLAYVAALVPGLVAMEVTFMAPGIAGWLRLCLDRLQQLRQQQKTQTVLSSRHHRPSSGVALPAASSSTASSVSSSSRAAPVIYGDGSSFMYGSRPRVWQFSCMAGFTDALQALEEVEALCRTHSCSATHNSTRSSSSSSSSRAGGMRDLLQAQEAALDPACLAMAISCAANCSSRGRSTPLHMAADAGCACHISALLSAGAAVSARDASGASPLFVACESGRAAAAAVLLGAGADALVRNTAGETPLYIAALRGHLTVVELLLGHLSAADVDWTQRQLYGDAWTPLMAAAVANRVSVACCLLKAAATRCCGTKPGSGHHSSPALTGSSNLEYRNSRSTSSSSSSSSSSSGELAPVCAVGSCPGVARLLAAENRYGQTVLHIAAWKGCRELLQLLLYYGAGHVAGRITDAEGDTPLDVARRHGHETAVRELQQQC